MSRNIHDLIEGALFTDALTAARQATADIIAMGAEPLGRGESLADRTLLIARAALVLADAFSVIDSLCLPDSPRELRVEVTPLPDNPNVN